MKPKKKDIDELFLVCLETNPTIAEEIVQRSEKSKTYQREWKKNNRKNGKTNKKRLDCDKKSDSV